jgi:hypothetical protein
MAWTLAIEPVQARRGGQDRLAMVRSIKRFQGRAHRRAGLARAQAGDRKGSNLVDTKLAEPIDTVCYLLVDQCVVGAESGQYDL